MPGRKAIVAATLWVCGIAASGWSAETPGTVEFTLTRQGQPAAVIVVADKPTRAAQFAAFELRYHLKLISGASLPIVSASATLPPLHLTTGDTVAPVRILVGASAGTDALGLGNDRFTPQEYLIRFAPNALVLLGRDEADTAPVDYRRPNTWPDLWSDAGTVYAVYDFLERFCEVRWFSPTAYGTDYRVQATLKVRGGGDVRRRPAFRFRGGSAAWRHSQPTSTCWNPGSDGFKAWMQAAFPEAALDPDAPSTGPANWDSFNLFMYRRRGGGEQSQCNHSFYHFYPRYWEKDPKQPELFVGKRPELFAKGWEGQPPQPDFLSDEVVKITLADIDRYFAAGTVDPQDKGGALWRWGRNFYALEPNDNSFFSRDPKSEVMYRPDALPGGRHSDYWFTFVNRVAGEVKKKYPDKWISTLAYGSHEAVPSFPLESNVVVHFCFSANRMPYDKQSYGEQMTNLKKWLDTGTPLYLWLYNTFPREKADNGNFFMFPGFFAHEFDKQMKYFQKVGIRGIFHCGWGEEVDNYIGYKLLDDPALDVDALINEYFTRMYGKAGEPLKKMYLLIEQTYCDPANYPRDYVGHQSADVAWTFLGTPERIGQMAGWMAEAYALAGTDLQKKRVELWDKGIWSYLKAGRQYADIRNATPAPAATAPRVAAAGGDPRKVEWGKAGTLGGTWFVRGGKDPAPRALSGRVAHDGDYLYVELTDPVTTAKLVASPAVFACDTWEVYIAKQRDLPYRQYAMGPTGLSVALSHFEVNWRMNVVVPDSGMKVVSDTAAPDRWVSYLALPMKTVLPGGIAAGQTVYLNVVRVSNRDLSPVNGQLGIDTWSSYTTVHSVDRLGAVALAP